MSKYVSTFLVNSEACPQLWVGITVFEIGLIPRNNIAYIEVLRINNRNSISRDRASNQLK